MESRNQNLIRMWNTIIQVLERMPGKIYKSGYSWSRTEWNYISSLVSEGESVEYALNYAERELFRLNPDPSKFAS